MAAYGTYRVPSDSIPSLPAAGRSEANDLDSAAVCLRPALNPEHAGRPPTPEGNQRKFRQSYKQQVGLRFTHTGLVDQQLPPAYTRFGVRTDTGERAGDALESAPSTELGSFLIDHKESIYRSHKREPLGQGYSRGHVLPGFTQSEQFRYGKHSSSSESAKNLIYLHDAPTAVTRREVPEKSVTRQLSRGYDWSSPGIDPRTHRFGVVARDGMADGVAQSIKQIKPGETKIGSARVEQVRDAMNDPLGRQKNVRGTVRDLPPDFAFGARAAPIDDWGARKCIRGDYSPAEMQPDRDLGVSTRKLTKLQQVPNDPTRVFGTPSIRFDRSLPPIKSIANSQNWGDEHDAKGLLYPSGHASAGVGEEDFLRERKPDEIRKLFARLGEEFDDATFNTLVNVAVRDFGALSVDSFRHAMNQSRLQVNCPICGIVQCQHEFCRSLPCRHDSSANHAPHATHT